MPENDPALALLNVFEVEREGVSHHLICFLDTVRAGAEGIDASAVVGEFTPGADGGFDPDTFRLNDDFIETFTHYMNEVEAHSSALAEQAAAGSSGWLYILDPRYGGRNEDEPAPRELVGRFAVDGFGQIVANSFQYNEHHRWFDPDTGVSGVLSDRKFYDWLHPSPDRKK